MKPFAYFSFWLKSSNEHGIHSPFVFNWIMQGLYVKNSVWDAMPKKAVFVERVFAYFKPQKVAWLSDYPVSDKIAQQSVFFSSVDSMRDSDTAIQMIYIDQTQKLDAIGIIEALKGLGNNAFVLVDKRCRSAELKGFWQQLITNPKITVTMDFYYFGLAFVRKEQLKQHFTIRL